LLKSAGASPKLTIIIVGESLLNDGTAMVMFNIFNNCLNGKTYSIGDIVSYFFAACLGAITFGAAMGYCAIRWLRRTNRPLSQVDVLVQIAITLCCAYTSFFVAENTFGISGVLACVGAGGMISWLGPPIILNHETMHHVWGMIEWALNTMIFLLAGLIIGDRVFEEVIPIDWFYCFVLYVLMIVIRSFVLLVLFPLISNYGHKCTVNEAIFMSWGGLRGVCWNCFIY
jgi:NhaP-type Na+/H+ or K+/H+ antiporter